jgi:prepilin-type processing-associated H-X9-DG protein
MEFNRSKELKNEMRVSAEYHPGPRDSGRRVGDFQSSTGFLLLYRFVRLAGSSGRGAAYFATAGQVTWPAITPVMFDGAWVDTWPTETDYAPRNLYQEEAPYLPGVGHEMDRIAIARHGALSPKMAPQNLTGNPVLPGAVNMVFFDGHTELVRLQDLWTYYWYVGCKPLASGHPAVQ